MIDQKTIQVVSFPIQYNLSILILKTLVTNIL